MCVHVLYACNMCACVCVFYYVSTCMTFDLSVSFIGNVQVRGHGLGLRDDNMMYVICIPLNLCRARKTFVLNSWTVWDICANVSAGFCVVLIYVLPLNLCSVYDLRPQLPDCMGHLCQCKCTFSCSADICITSQSLQSVYDLRPQRPDCMGHLCQRKRRFMYSAGISITLVSQDQD